MVQPIRPQDVSNVYRQQSASTSRTGRGADGNDSNATRGANGGGRRSDQVMLSEEALQLQRVLESIAGQPAEREQRIEALRAQIADGTYDRDLDTVARRMVQDGLLS
jgi:flagellar biosynthesis anti-sigma factor FlgM